MNTEQTSDNIFKYTKRMLEFRKHNNVIMTIITVKFNRYNIHALADAFTGTQVVG